jgi:hypothetical protein
MDGQGSNFSKRACCLGRLQTPLKLHRKCGRSCKSRTNFSPHSVCDFRDLPHFRCRSTSPAKTQLLGKTKAYEKPSWSGAEELSFLEVTWSYSFEFNRLQPKVARFAPNVRKIRLKCSATDGMASFANGSYPLESGWQLNGARPALLWLALGHRNSQIFIPPLQPKNVDPPVRVSKKRPA